MNSRFALPGGVTLKPPNGGVSFCSAEKRRLAQHRQLGERRAAGDRFRIDAGEMLRPAGRGHRARDLRGQPREQILLARGGIAGFERVEEVGHGALAI